MSNKFKKLIPILLLLSLVFVGCGQTATETDADANPMQYVSVEDLKADVESGSSEFIMLDVRKAEDFDAAHLVGAYAADLDAAKNGDAEDGTAKLEAALEEATGSPTGNDGEKYALICYSGKSYAQTATDLMVEMGISADQIYTVEGGMTAWEEGGDDYKALME